jgi:hypothetical protein
VGVVQHNPKTVLAYSSISQMGIIMTGLGIGAIRPEAWAGMEAAVLIYATTRAGQGRVVPRRGSGPRSAQRRQRVVAARDCCWRRWRWRSAVHQRRAGEDGAEGQHWFSAGRLGDGLGYFAALGGRGHHAEDGAVPVAGLAARGHATRKPRKACGGRGWR